MLRPGQLKCAPRIQLRCALVLLVVVASVHALPIAAADSARMDAKTGVRIEIRDAANVPAAGTVVYLQGEVPEMAPANVPHGIIDQRDKTFVPGYVVVQRGTPIEFPNHDTVSHHVYSFSDPNAFELPLYKGAPVKPVIFERAGVVTLGCNIHDRMLAFVVVVETPYFGITAADGTFFFPAVRAGRYQVMVWNPRLDPAKPSTLGSLEVTVGATPETRAYRLATQLKPAPAAAANSLAWGDY